MKPRIPGQCPPGMESALPRPLHLTRRGALRAAGAAFAAAALPRGAVAQDAPPDPATAGEPRADAVPAPPPPLRKAVKYGMVEGDAPLLDKFHLLKRLGFDGVEMDSPNALDAAEVLRARDESGLAIHGVVDSIHWTTRLSDPDAAVRQAAVQGLCTALRDAKTYGGSSVLLVPGRVADPERENHDQVWQRSIEGIRAALPLAAELGVHILIENVWNGFLYDHDGGDDQTADRFAAYLDDIASPWVGAYLDLGNHRKYGLVEDWVRTLGRRIVKLDVKDWGRQSGWAKIGEGDVDWAAVREALAQIRFTGWCTAEVNGGGEEWLAEVKARMDLALG